MVVEQDKRRRGWKLRRESRSRTWDQSAQTVWLIDGTDGGLPKLYPSLSVPLRIRTHIHAVALD